MGIHNLLKYIGADDMMNLTQRESGNNIYISNILYFDITYKLIEIYKKYMKIMRDKERYINDDMSNERSNKLNIFEVENLLKIYHFDSSLNDDITEEYRLNVGNFLNYMENELLNLFGKLKSFNRMIYVFVDYRFMNNIKERKIIYKDFLNMNVEDNERINAIPMIKRKYLKLLDGETKIPDDERDEEMINEHDVLNYLIKKVRCMFELKSIYAISNKLNIEKYISIPYLIKTEKNESGREKLTILLNEGKFRYLILRGGKYDTKKQRGKDLFSLFSHPYRHKCEDNKYVDRTHNVDKLLFNYVMENGYDKVDEFYNYIPFTIIIYLFPIIIKRLNLDDVKFFGCEIESDFAISKHIYTYSTNAFPTICSSDTDMLCLMCDIDCIVKLLIKNKCRIKTRKNGNDRKSEYYNSESSSVRYISREHTGKKETSNSMFYINPVEFWQKVFKCKLSSKIIKILCVLKGTDYNPYHYKSPIHIKHFEDILKILNVDKFEDIDEDILLTYIYMVMKNNENNIYCEQTAIALNIYLNELEDEIHILTEDTNINKINLNRFLKYSKRTVFDNL